MHVCAYDRCHLVYVPIKAGNLRPKLIQQRPQADNVTRQGHTKIYLRSVSICQLCYYFRTFPKDSMFHKCLVGLICIGSTFQMYCMITLQVLFLVKGHHGVPGNLPAFPWQGTANTVQMFSIPFVVQCFYAWRLWIISRRNVLLVASIILLSASEFVSGVGFIFGLRLPAFALRVAVG
ncbi:hypothetical protein EDD17DRAFT_527076 [Pisolithus thermaeus]|nr:hypothetical protein EDD17DRAFT_527076 [Pisolithus thermaeus]